MVTNQRVKVLKGAFRDCIGELHSKFNYNGKELFTVRFNKFIDKQTSKRLPGWTTVLKEEYEVTDKPETRREY